MATNLLVPGVALIVVEVMMIAEQRVSSHHERQLFARGAVQPPDAVYRTMRWAYPGAFALMAAEGAWVGPAPAAIAVLGGACLVLAKALKCWAIASLGVRWTFRVIVLPNAPLVTSGPYKLMRHPNYVAVVGELTGMAMLVGAWATGLLATGFFVALLRRRIKGEESALGMA